ncbi:MAG TPA: right-handed parallel beta-helix repeat-containing protein [Phenylobacterium sp.]
MTRVPAVLCGLLLVPAFPAAAATTTVSNGDALWKALKAAAPGDVVQLASGTYPVMRFDHFVKAAPGVTVRAAPGARPVLGGLVMDGAEGLNFTGFEIAISDPKIQFGANVSDSQRIRFDRLTVHRSEGAKGAGGGVGVFLRLTSDASVTNSEFYNLGVGTVLLDDRTILVKGNRYHDLETDGVDVAGTIDPTIDGNSFTDFYPAPGDHPDAIQFWATNINPVGKNAVVTNNVIRRGKGEPMPMQGIFAENQANMIIRGNGMVCTLYNGISVARTATALIEDNFVQACPDYGTRIIARDGSSDVTVRNNQITDKVIDLHQATDKDNVRFSMKGNVNIAGTKVGDSTAMDAWLAKRPAAH